MSRRTGQRLLALLLAVLAVGGGYVAVRELRQQNRTNVVAYFENSNGIYVGDDVRIRGVTVGRIEAIEPQPTQVKVSFWVDSAHPVPADAKAVILSPTLVAARAVQLTPPYRSGPVMVDHAVIDRDRTVVPLEWDDFRTQLERLTETLQPTEPSGVSTLGGFVSTAADNLRGQGPAIRDAVVKLSQVVSALGDHSDDIFTSVKNLSLLVTALQDSTDLIRQLNGNLSAVTGQLANDPDEVAHVIRVLDESSSEVAAFVRDNREALGTTTERLSAVSSTLVDSLDDLKQLLHIAPTTLGNFINSYNPAQATLTGALAVNNFANPINFLCGAVQAASRMNAEQSAKLCVQYLAPIVKNRQYNFPPLGMNPVVGTRARPNEITYSEDWMRPDYVPPQVEWPPLPAEEPRPTQQTDPSVGLAGMMVPSGGGS
ncbi:mammalian cell entry protein [Mycobacterium sp. ACS4331]|nr:mammalian cell entry protein [Mycobacterium sp. ACS4331]